MVRWLLSRWLPTCCSPSRGAELVNAEVCAYGLGDVCAVAGQHHRFAHACGMQIGDGLLGVRLDGVADDEGAGVGAVDGHMHLGADEVVCLVGDVVQVHELVVAGEHDVAIDDGFDAVATQLLAR